MLSMLACEQLALRIYVIAVVKNYHEQPVSPIAFGLLDVAFWSAFLANISVIYIFAAFVSVGAFGRLRPFVVIATPVIPACVAGVTIMLASVQALYGPPEKDNGT